MSDSQNWRTDTNAQDYFTHQKKQIQVSDRRPVIRRASDLVGPGIGASAIRISDFNDLSVLYNGYYSAVPGVLNGPPLFSATLTSAMDPDDIVGLSITSLVQYIKQGQRMNIATPVGFVPAHSEDLFAAWDAHPGATKVYIPDTAPSFIYPTGSILSSVSPMIAQTITDSELGGVQRVWILDQPGVSFDRVFLRSQFGGSVFWGAWERVDQEDSEGAFFIAQNYGAPSFVPPGEVDVALSGLPPITHKSSNFNTYFEITSSRYEIKRPGLYSITAWTRLGEANNENEHSIKINVSTIVTQTTEVHALNWETVTLPVDDSMLANNGSVDVNILMTPAASTSTTNGYYAIAISRVGGIV